MVDTQRAPIRVEDDAEPARRDEPRKEYDAQELARRALRQLTRDRAAKQREVRAVADEERDVVRRAVSLAIALPILMVLTALNLSGYGPFRVEIEEPPVAERMRRMREAVSFTAYELSAYQERHGEVPADLGVIGVPDPQRWEYERLGSDRYRLRLVSGELALEYDSSIDPEDAFADVRHPR